MVLYIETNNPALPLLDIDLQNSTFFMQPSLFIAFPLGIDVKRLLPTTTHNLNEHENIWAVAEKLLYAVHINHQGNDMAFDTFFCNHSKHWYKTTALSINDDFVVCTILGCNVHYSDSYIWSELLQLLKEKLLYAVHINHQGNDMAFDTFVCNHSKHWYFSVKNTAWFQCNELKV